MHNLATPPVNPEFHTRYAAEVAEGHLAPDHAQREAVQAMDAVHRAWLKEESGVSGIYLWGDVGRGKSKLADLFFHASPIAPKQRVHFHRFMQEVHRRIHATRTSAKAEKTKASPAAHPVEAIAQAIAKKEKLLFLDELQVTDVADAMILSRLFTVLLDAGVHIVFTSNRPPEELYTGGLQREGFLPFIHLVRERMLVHRLAAQGDYRLKQLQSLKQTYVYPLDAKAEHFLQDAVATLGAGETPEKTVLRVQGREVTLACLGDEVALATFDELCARPLGAADYLTIAERFRTLVLARIPALGPEKRNEARRFVTLIDVLYDHKVKLIATAAAPPEALYPQGDGSFEFARTASRLVEMQSEAYLAAPPQP